MEMLLKHLTNIVEVDEATMLIIIMICGLAVWLIRENLANPIMIIFIFPLIWFLSLLFYYIFANQELFMSNRIDQWLMWVLMAGSLGVSIGIALVAACAHYWDRPTAR